MDVFKSIYQYYEEMNREPDIKRQWVEGYLRELLARKASEHRLADVWNNISMFMAYQGRSEYHDLAKLPFWEYSVCLQRLASHRSFRLNHRHGEKFLMDLLDFYGYLERTGHIGNKHELDKAIEGMCSTSRLKLVDRIPFTGDELWIAVYPGNGSEASFTIKDFWLALLYEENGSWRKLKEEAMKADNPDQKLALIGSFYERLDKVGYATPQRLFSEEATYEDVADAKRWFYRGKTPSIKWMSI